MVFVLWIDGVKGGFEGEVFDADLGDRTDGTDGTDGCAGFEGRRDGRINRDDIALDRFHNPIPGDVARAGFPTAAFTTAHFGSAELGDPVGGAGTCDANLYARLERVGILNANGLNYFFSKINIKNILYDLG